MPRISFSDYSVECKEGANLRRVLLDAKLPLYNGVAKTIHCRRLGTCGTCAIEIEGEVTEMTAVEKWRLRFPPHQTGCGLRLACQCKVMGDLKINKHGGYKIRHFLHFDNSRFRKPIKNRPENIFQVRLSGGGGGKQRIGAC